jgi:hypothetical protein
VTLKSFFPYYGGKHRSATRYPPPQHATIVEPFAGSAGYALRYADRRVRLYDKSEAIGAIWSYLIRATSGEILRLPLLDVGQSVDTLPLPQEARWLIGMWVNPGSAQPKKTQTAWLRGDGCTARFSQWGDGPRGRIAAQVDHIRHWTVETASYEAAANEIATWFVDPPYRNMGRHYPCGADDIDFAALGAWCRERRGQVLVCEQAGASWLPFRAFGAFKSNQGHTERTRSAEALWLNDFPGAALWLPGGAA